MRPISEAYLINENFLELLEGNVSKDLETISAGIQKFEFSGKHIPKND